MIIGFTGTRYVTEGAQWRAFDRVFAKLVDKGAHTLVHGCCQGADLRAAQKAEAAGMHIVGRPGPASRWRALEEFSEMLPEKPFLQRNRDIVNHADVMIACPLHEKPDDGRVGGTWHTINYARLVNKPLYICFPDGRVRAEIMV